MINANEYKGYNLDAFYLSGFVQEIIQQTKEETKALTVKEIKVKRSEQWDDNG